METGGGAVNRPAAGTRIPVPVTQAHIDTGIPEDACGCAAALAITDAVVALDLVPEVDSVSVIYADDGSEGANARVWLTPGAWLRLTLGADCARFMWAVDTGQPVEPCTLTAEVA
jgi:hypothetical protein